MPEAPPKKPTKPLALYRAHRVLIGAGVFCALVLTFYEVRMYRKNGGGTSMTLAICGMAVAIALLAYLRYFNRKIAR